MAILAAIHIAHVNNISETTIVDIYGLRLHKEIPVGFVCTGVAIYSDGDQLDKCLTGVRLWDQHSYQPGLSEADGVVDGVNIRVGTWSCEEVDLFN